MQRKLWHCYNVLSHPHELKYRRVRHSVPAVATNILGVTGCADLLTTFGFHLEMGAEGPAFFLPQDEHPHAVVATVVDRELQKLQAKSDPAKQARLESMEKRAAAKAVAEKEKQAILAQAAKDREERKQDEADKGGVQPSKAVDLKFGAEAHRTAGIKW